MREMLKPHPDSTPPADLAITVAAMRLSANLLELDYRVTGDVEALALPDLVAPERSDGLWRHTCFEAFVRPEGSDAYVELNFAPSSLWAAYRFDSRRTGMRPLALPALRIEVRSHGDRFALAASIDLPDLAGADWRLGLSAVIEETDGRKSWWALAHPPGRPDFHHDDCFAARLAAIGPA